MTHTPDVITYSSDYEVKAAGVLKTYVRAPNKEKIRTVLGPVFKENAGKSAIIVRALYSLKSEVASFRAHLAQCMQESENQFCDPDPDLWMKPE